MLDYEKERKELIAKHTANVRKWNKNNPNHRISGVMPEGYKPPKEYKKSVTQWDFTQKRKAAEQKKKKSVTKNSFQPKMSQVSNKQVNIQTGKYKTNNSKEFREKKGTRPLSNGKKDTKLYDQIKGAGKNSKAGERVKNTVKGTGKQIGGQYLNAAVTPFAEGKISSAKVKAQNDLGGAGVRKEPVKGNTRKYDTTYYKTRKQVEQEKKEQTVLKKQTQEMQKNFERGVKQTQNTASALRQSGAKDIEKAKKGLGTAGKFGIDLASQMMMWGGDAAIGAATGTGLLTPMFIRSFGDASMTARESGATHGQQMFAGLVSGSIEAATEKLFSPYKIFKKTAGAGFADNLVEKATYKIADKIATKLAKSGVPSNALYKAVRNTLKAGSGMIEEGAEEVLADLAQPLYERSYDKDALKQYGTKEYWQNVGRDFGMGAAMAGVLGGSSGIINKARSAGSDVSTSQPYTEKEKSQAIKAAKAQGEETKAYKYALELETQQKNGKEILDAQVDDLAQKTFQEQYATQKAIIEQQEATERAKMASMQEVAGDTESFMNDRMTNIEAQAVNEVISRRVGNNASRIADNLINVFHADPEIAASQAESIARIKTGTATAADLNVGAVTNIEARAALQRELKTPLPATNAETLKKLAEYAGTARAVQKRTILEEARQSARAEMFQTFTQGMDDMTADIFADGMEKVQIADMPKYMEAFATYYQGGRVNYAYDKIPIAKQYKGYITESIKMAAYNAGNQVYQTEQAQAAEAQKNIVKGERRNGSLEISDKSVGKIGKEQANALRMMTEVGGKKVVVLDQIDAGSHKDVANGKYQDGTIYISAKSEAPIFDVLKHELTHNLQETAPEAYNELKQYVFQKFYESDHQKYDAMVHNMIEHYAKSGVELTRAQAEDELLADATDVFFNDSDAIQDLVNENRSLGEKLLDGIRSLLDTLHRMATGAYSEGKTQNKGEWLETLGIVEEAERLWVKALNESIGTKTQSNSSTQYVLKGKDFDGIEVYETSEDIKSLSMKEKRAKAIDLVSNEFRGRTAKFSKGNQAYYARFQKTDIQKNVYGDKKSSNKGYLAKINSMAENNYIELVENANYDRSAKESGKNAKSHKNVTNWDYYVKEVSIDGVYYDVLINVRQKAEEEYVYDITLVENENKKDKVPSLARMADAPALKSKATSSSINNSISNSIEKINSSKEKFSLKDQEIKPFEMNKKQVLDNMKFVAEMKPVATLTGNEFAKGSVDLITQVSDFFDEIGNIASNPVLGEVEINRNGVKSSIGHGIGRLKAIAFKAVPEVISKGEIIDAQYNWKDRGYDTIVIAASVKIGDEAYYIGTVINRNKERNTQHYYLHEVGIVKKNSMPSKTVASQSGGSHGGNTAPIYNLLQQLNSVNSLTEKDIVSDEGKFQLKDQEIKSFEMDKRQILSNMRNVAKMDSVCSLGGEGFESEDGKKLSDAIMESYGNHPFMEHNKTLGDVKVTKRGIKSSTQHKPLYGTKIEGFKAIREVIREGEVIHATKNYNNKNYDRVIVAAPIEISENQYYMGVIINRSHKENLQNYYIHDVVLAKRNSPAIKDSVTTNGLRVDRTVSPYIILQQLNDINNLTEKDIVSDEGKFQLKDENKKLRKQLSAEKELSKKLKAEFKRSKYATPDPKQSGKAVNKLIETYLGRRDARLHQSIMQDIEQVYKEMRKTEGNWNLVDDLCRNVADKIVSNMEILHDEMWNQYTDLRKTLRNTTIKLTEAHWNDIADFEDLRKSHFGTVRLSKQNGVSIDTFYQELAETYPELFDAAEYTNEVDQLYNILDVVDSMKPYTEDYSSGEIAEFADSIAKDVLQMSYDLAQKKTFADIKFEEKQQAVEKVKAERNSIMKKQRERMQKRIEKKDDFYRQKIADVKQKYRDRNDRRYYTKRIEAYAQWMSDALLRPTDTKHLPNGYAEAIATMLEGFDFSTERTDAYTEKNGPSKRTLKFAELRNAYQKLADQETTEIEIDQSVKELLDELSANLDGKRFSDLGMNQLKSVYKLIKQIRFSLSTINKTFSEGLRKNISDYGQSIIAETGSIHHKNRTGTKHSAGEFLTLSNTTPWDAFALMGDTMKQLYQNMRSGFDKHVQNASSAMEFIQALSKQYDVKSWIDDKAKPQSFVVGGRQIELVPSQIMSLYCLMQREQAMKHIIEGSGMTAAPLPVIDKKRQKITKAWSQRVLDTSHVIPTLEEVKRIISTLTSEQRKVADALQKFMNETCSDWGNETALKLYGYKKFGEKNYFPIKSSDAFLAESFDSKMNPSKIKNVGFTKNTVMNAHNPIVLDDIFNVFTQHVNTMSMYNALVPAITDFERVFNYKQREGGKQAASVHGSLQQAFGNGAVNYITQFMKDVNQNYVKNRDHALANKLVANYKKAKIGANLRVLLQQPTAITRAMAVMSPKYLLAAIPSAKSIPGLAKKARQEMQEHCPIARWKSWGFYNTDIARDMRDIFLDKKNIVDKMFMDMYGAADDFTWSIIWRAAKKEIKATKTDLAEGSDAYWKAVSDRFSYIVDRTQVVDSVFHRSQIMRKQDLFSKTITSFMAEPTKTWNLLKTEYTLAERELKSGNKAAAIKRVSRVTTTHLVTAAFTGAAAALIDALRGSGEDDDDKDFLENWLSYVGQGFVDNANPINLLPGLRDLTSLIQGYDVSRMDMAGMADLINSLQYWQSDTATPYFALKKTVGGIASVTGLPVGSLWRDVESIAKETAKLFVTEAKVEFVMKKLRYNINDSRNRSKFAKVYVKAEEKGDTATAGEIRSEMLSKGANKKKWEQSVKTQQKNIAAAKAAKLILDGKENEAQKLIRSYCSQNEWEYEKMWPKAVAEAEKRKSIFQKAYDETLKILIQG